MADLLARGAGALMEKLLRLPPRRNRISITRSVPVPMNDGTVLLADHFAPDVGDDPRPTVLIRTPYGRSLPSSLFFAQPYAERGYHVLVQSVRGTFGSGGTFAPMAHEIADAQDTVVWLRKQPWFDGRLATSGGSYLGFTQWALAVDPPPELKAMIIQVGPHDFGKAVRGTGSFTLYDFLMWSETIAHQERSSMLGALLRMRGAEQRVGAAADLIPYAGAAESLVDSRAPWFADWATKSDVDDPFWTPMNASAALEKVSVPTLIVGGWHDIFIDQGIEQYNTLNERGVEVGLTVGPWTHLTMTKDYGKLFPQSLAWLDTHAAGGGRRPRAKPVQVWVGGAGEWRDLDVWPPADVATRTWSFGAGGRLIDGEGEEGATSFRYDPNDPTPSVGGRRMTRTAGMVDNAALEARADVLTFTTEPLTEAIEVLGQPVVEIHMRSDNPHADVFARLCDVDENGVSRNITDQLVRLDPAAGTDRRVRIPLFHCAHRFAVGHRLRLQVSGGAHPRFARNLGTGEDGGIGTATAPVTNHVVYDSSLSLPVC